MKSVFFHLLSGVFLLASTFAVAQETRIWTASDGERTFEGLYVYHKEDVVCLADKLGKEFTIPIDKISIADRVWLRKKKYEQRGEKSPQAIDSLRFDDDIDTILNKLENSNLFTLKGSEPSSIEDINKAYQLKTSVGQANLNLSIFLDTLNVLGAVQLSSDTPSDLESIKSDWEACKELFTELAGSPQKNQGFPSSQDLKDNENHWVTSEWKTKSNQHLLLAITLNKEGEAIIEARILPIVDGETVGNPEFLAQIKNNLTS